MAAAASAVRDGGIFGGGAGVRMRMILKAATDLLLIALPVSRCQSQQDHGAMLKAKIAAIQPASCICMSSNDDFFEYESFSDLEH